MARRFFRRSWPLALLCSVMASAAAAQAPGGIRVRVIGPDGKPIEAAEVLIGPGAGAGGEAASVLSDADGVAVIDPSLVDPQQGVDVTVSAVGYGDARLHVGPGTPQEVAVRLGSEKQETGIVVRGRRVSRPFSPHVLDLVDIVTDARANADPVLATNNLPASTNVSGNATLNLRATRASINRLYLADIPVFEFARGANLDSTTQAGSIFNLGNTKDVEVYPGNPPLYLTGSSGGVVRTLPPTAANPGGNLALNTAAVGLSYTFTPGDAGSFATLSGLYSDLQPQLSLNPGLSKLISRLHLRSAGAVGRANFGPKSALSVFAQAETEDGRYPVEVLGARQHFGQDADRVRLLSSYSAEFGSVGLTVNGAYTRSEARQAFAGWSSRNENRYMFYSLDLASEAAASRLTVRGGIDADIVSQESNQSLYSSIVPIGAAAPNRVRNRNTELSAYGFAAYRISPSLLVSLGGRHVIASSLRSTFGLQASATLTSSDKRHKLIVSLGRYPGAEIPQQAYYGGLARSVSRQVEADYSFTVPRLRLGLSLYHSDERSDRTRSALEEGRFFVFDDALTGVGRRTVTSGLEAYAVASPVEGLEAKLSFSTIDQTVRVAGAVARGSNDFGYILRASARYQLGVWALNLAATARDGAPFTRIAGLAFGPDGRRRPILGPLNGERLRPYFSVDLSVARPIAISGKLRPLAFLSVKNLLDRRNLSSQILTAEGEPARFREFAGRVATFGISLNF